MKGGTVDKFVAEFIDAHPGVYSKKEMARLLRTEYPDRFSSLEAARTAIRRVTGGKGRASLTPDSPYYREWDPNKEHSISYREMYAYNSATDDYVFFTWRISGKLRSLKSHQVKAILDRYSNFDKEPNTINEIALNFGLRREEVIFILRALGFTHDSLPFTKEMIMASEPDQMVEDLFLQKRSLLYEKYTKRSWDEIQAAAKQWDEFEAGTLNPIREFIETFQYAHKVSKVYNSSKHVTNRSFLFTLSDPHFGAYANSNELFYGEGWDIDKALNCIKLYVEKFVDYIQSVNSPPFELYIAIMGDLVHSTTGVTTKGTKIENAHPLGVEQISYCYEGLDYLLQCLLNLKIAGKNQVSNIVVADTEGNHDAIADWAVVQLLMKAYQNDSRVKFLGKRSRWVAFQIFKNLFVIEHGSSPYYKSKVPESGPVRKAYVQDVLIQATNEFPNSINKYFLTADRHSFEHSESTHFEFIRLSSMMHDRYTDHLNLHSRPRQTIFDVRPEGMVADIHFYFETEKK